MISDNSIQEVRDKAELLEVAGRYTKLKKKGASHSGCCPFHDEKTGSFSVNEVKGIYKCFGCGAGGNGAISFIMAKERLEFIEAVKYLASWFNVTLEETQATPEEKEKAAGRAEFLNINAKVAKLYQRELFKFRNPMLPAHPIWNELTNFRRLTETSIVNFQLGYAPDDFKFLSPKLIEQGMFVPAEKLGLVKSSVNSNNYDIYRNRIIFPVHNERGEVIGFCGRKIEDNKKENPKYINSVDSAIYSKGNVLYGLYQAARAIREMKFAVMVEGNYDVVSFHQTGMANTVAPCGTALTEGHAKLLKRHTNHVVLIGDQDAAGQRANLKNVDMLLKHGFKIEICELPEGQDPDSFSRTFKILEETA